MSEKMQMVTEWTSSNEIIHTEYGHIPYEEWLWREMRRINNGGTRVFIARRNDGCVGLAHSKGV